MIGEDASQLPVPDATQPPPHPLLLGGGHAADTAGATSSTGWARPVQPLPAPPHHDRGGPAAQPVDADENAWAAHGGASAALPHPQAAPALVVPSSPSATSAGAYAATLAARVLRRAPSCPARAIPPRPPAPATGSLGDPHRVCSSSSVMHDASIARAASAYSACAAHALDTLFRQHLEGAASATTGRPATTGLLGSFEVGAAWPRMPPASATPPSVRDACPC